MNIATEILNRVYTPHMLNGMKPVYACPALVEQCSDRYAEFHVNSSVEQFIFSDYSSIIIDRESQHVTVCDEICITDLPNYLNVDF